MITKPLLSQNEKDQIQASVMEAEKNTSGEIVLVIVRSSDTYPEAQWRIAVGFSFLMALTLYWVDPALDPLWYLLVQIPSLLFGYALSNLGNLRRISLSETKVKEEVHQRALQAFYSNHLSSTQNRTGILLFISLLEHRVEILADSGIHTCVKEGAWNDIIQSLLSQIQNGQLTRGICHAVQECGKILTESFPAQGKRSNQLPNHVLIED
jgi:putative membrane protein